MANNYELLATDNWQLSSALYLCRESSTNSPSFMQNKPNLCVFWAASGDCQEKQTQFKPNSKPICAGTSRYQSQSNPIFVFRQLSTALLSTFFEPKAQRSTVNCSTVLLSQAKGLPLFILPSILPFLFSPCKGQRPSNEPLYRTSQETSDS